MLIAIMLLIAFVMGMALSWQNCNVQPTFPGYQVTNSYPPNCASSISPPILGSVTALGAAYVIIFLLLLILVVVLSSLVYVSQGYDIMKNKTLSLKRSVGMALRKLPVAYVSNLIVILLYLATYAALGYLIVLILTISVGGRG